MKRPRSNLCAMVCSRLHTHTSLSIFSACKVILVFVQLHSTDTWTWVSVFYAHSLRSSPLFIHESVNAIVLDSGRACFSFSLVFLTVWVFELFVLGQIFFYVFERKKTTRETRNRRISYAKINRIGTFFPFSDCRRWLCTFNRTMDSVNIVEFRTTWNNEAFLRNRSGLSAAQRLVRKSVTIGKPCISIQGSVLEYHSA